MLSGRQALSRYKIIKTNYKMYRDLHYNKVSAAATLPSKEATATSHIQN